MQWQPDGFFIHTDRWFLGAGFLGAPPISLTYPSCGQHTLITSINLIHIITMIITIIIVIIIISSIIIVMNSYYSCGRAGRPQELL